MPEISVSRKQRQPFFQGVSSNPIIRIRQLHAGCEELSPQSAIDGRSVGARLQDLKGIEKLTRFLKSRRRDFCVRLSKEELAGDVRAKHRRVMT